MKYKHIAWDSNFFEFNVARIELKNNSRDLLEILNFLKIEGYTLIYGFSKTELDDNDEVLTAFHGKLMDKKITYVKTIDDVTSLNYNENIEKYITNKVNANLINLAIQSGEYSRFKLDRRIPKEKFKELYWHWLINSINKKVAKEVYVYIENEISGFITLTEKNGKANIGLIAVDRIERGKGIGKILMESAEIWATENLIPNIQVVTQEANFKACKFYENCGYKLDKKEFIYHFWL